MTRNVTTLLFAAILMSGAAQCQLVDDYNPPRANCCLQGTAQSLADQLQDWNQLGRDHADNEKLKAQPADPKRVVFLGDPITDGWKLAQSFPGKPYVNRVSGQTTPQMLVRMFPDVISLKPAALIILAGTKAWGILAILPSAGRIARIVRCLGPAKPTVSSRRRW